MEKTISVSGMSCNHCKSAIEQALQNLDSVSNIYVDINKQIVNLTYDENNINLIEIINTIEELGYEVIA